MLQLLKKNLVLILLCSLSCGALAAKDYHYKSAIDINKLFQRASADHAFPGGCVIAGTSDRVILKQCFGYHTYKKDIPDTINDVFDIASMTKVIGTTTAIMKLYEQHKIKLSDKVVLYLPEFSGPNPLHSVIKSTITIADLLSHRSGLQECNSIDRMGKATLKGRSQCLMQTPLKYYPRRKMIYADLNFILLSKVVERVSGENLDHYLNREVFRPLDMQQTSFHPSGNYRHIVPTSSAQRVGIVHDPIARNLGGVSGHAGLFSSANDLQHFAQMMLNAGRYNNTRIFQPETIDLFTQRNEVITDSTRALGWDTAYLPSISNVPHQFSAGNYIDANAYGHTGYTGTSIWISPKHDLYVILLTNRVFENAAPARQQAQLYWRQQITSAIWKNLGFSKQNSLYHELRAK
jgi:CubicO group peptidase (beta-lactamase class C family)